MDHKIQYCPYCGTRTREEKKYGVMRPVCPQCGWIYFRDPKVAVAALVENEDKVLMVKRSVQPEIGKWALPAGYMNAEEDPQVAAKREVKEETGLNIKIQGLIEVFSGREHRNGADLILLYRGLIIDGHLQAGDDASEVGFFSMQNLPELAFKNTMKMLQHTNSSH